MNLFAQRLTLPDKWQGIMAARSLPYLWMIPATKINERCCEWPVRAFSVSRLNAETTAGLGNERSIATGPYLSLEDGQLGPTLQQH